MLCMDVEEMMSDPWDELKDGVLEALRDGVKDFVADTKPELQAFLSEKAREIAREKWASLMDPDPARRDEASRNLKHLHAHVVAEASRLALATNNRAKELLGKVLEVGLGVLIKVGPKIIGG